MAKFTAVITLNDESTLNRSALAQTLAAALKGQVKELEIMGGGAQRKRLDDETRQAIIAARREGSSYGELAETFNVSTAVINKILRDAGMTNPRSENGGSSAAPRRSATKVTIGPDGSVNLVEVRPPAATRAAHAAVTADDDED